MAVSRREKTLLSLLIPFAGGVLIVFFLLLPAWDGIAASQKKLDTLRNEVTQLSGQESMLNAEIAQLIRKGNLPIDYTVRKYTAETLEENIKAMVDQIVSLATAAGNDLVSLEPFAPEEAPPPPPEPKGKDAKNAEEKPANGAATAEGETAPAKPEPPRLSMHGYTLVVRGAYASILNFLKSLNSHKELIEVGSIRLENEGGVERQFAATDVRPDPAKPIKLSVKIKLFLQPGE